MPSPFGHFRGDHRRGGRSRPGFAGSNDGKNDPSRVPPRSSRDGLPAAPVGTPRGLARPPDGDRPGTRAIEQNRAADLGPTGSVGISAVTHDPEMAHPSATTRLAETHHARLAFVKLNIRLPGCWSPRWVAGTICTWNHVHQQGLVVLAVSKSIIDVLAADGVLPDDALFFRPNAGCSWWPSTRVQVVCRRSCAKLGEDRRPDPGPPMSCALRRSTSEEFSDGRRRKGWSTPTVVLTPPSTSRDAVWSGATSSGRSRSTP